MTEEQRDTYAQPLEWEEEHAECGEDNAIPDDKVEVAET